MGAVVNSIISGIVVGVVGVVFATSFSTIIFSGALLPHLPNGIGIALFSATVMSAYVALTSSFWGTVAVPQDMSSVVFSVAAVAIAGRLSGAASGETLFATIVIALGITAASTGIFFFALGYFRLSGLIRYIPYPVIAGFLAATGWLLVMAAIGLMTGSLTDLSTLPALVASGTATVWVPGLVFGLFLYVVTRRIRRALMFPALMVGSILLFHLVLFATDTSFAEAGAAGWLLGPFPGGIMWRPVGPSMFLAADWGEIANQIPSIATIALLSVIGLLMNASALEVTTRHEVDLNRELRTAGVGNLLAALGGGMSGHLYLSLTLLSHKMGGTTRWVGLTVAVVCGATLLLGASVLSYLPKFVLGGVVAYLGIEFIAEWLLGIRRKLPTFDYLIVILIFVVASMIGFLPGIAVGVLASSVLFVVNYSRISVVRHSLSGASFHSNVARSEAQAELLSEAGGALSMLELDGFIFFGTANRLFHQIDALAKAAGSRLGYVVIDFTRVTGFDSSAVMSFAKLRQSGEAHGYVLVFTHLSPALKEQFEACDFSLHDDHTLRTIDEFDRGLEWCENEFLRAQGIDPAVEQEAILKMLRREFPAGVDVAEVSKYLVRREAAPGEYLIRQGEQSDDLYVIESGRVTVHLELDGGKLVRLLSTGCGPVGEVGLYTGVARTASVTVDEPAVVYRLTLDALARMGEEQPRLAAAFHQFIARRLALRLANTTRMLDAVRK